MKRPSMVSVKNPNYKHGGKGTRIYSIWKGMRVRCDSKNRERYPTYAGCGLTVSEEWQTSFAAFRDWSLENGYSDELSIDRKDTLKGYSKENCRWATDLEQNRNAKTNRWFNINGERLTMSQVCEKYGITQTKLSARVNKLGWTIEKAVLNVDSKREGVRKNG